MRIEKCKMSTVQFAFFNSHFSFFNRHKPRSPLMICVSVIRSAARPGLRDWLPLHETEKCSRL